MFCPYCGTQVEPTQKFCANCGKSLQQPQQATQPATVPPPAGVKTSFVSTPGNQMLPCPKCGRMTDSMKFYRLPDKWLFLGVYLSYSSRVHLCCPECMRKQILLHGFTYNIITANLMWPFLIMPWSVVNLCRSYQKGHSPEVVKKISEI